MQKDLGGLLKVNNARVEASTCTGKYRGTLDYSIMYDGGELFFANINNKRSKGEITVMVIESLTKEMQLYQREFVNSAEIWNALKERERKDNERAAEMGFKRYILKRLGITTKDSHCGWSYIVLDIDGKECLHTETGLNSDILNCNIDNLRSIKKFYLAGNYAECEIDFIQGGVGFISGKDGYTVNCEGITLTGG